MRRTMWNMCVTGAFGAIAGTALADEVTKMSRPLPIELTEIRELVITTRGRVIRDEIVPIVQPTTDIEAGAERGGCDQIASHTDAAFSGSGQFIVQAGFAENEVAAASYTVPAGSFPMRLNGIEMIVATSNATVQTVTQWSMMVWQGTPNNGALVETFTSDGSILPHITLGPGTAAINVQLIIDPGDPEQIIISNNGSNTFSVGFRIDQHHNQTQNPCFFAPPDTENAFPTTDTSGLLRSADNWLFGLNCGPFGCPANGGWARFSALPSFCRPSGDWVIRATYTPTNCQPGVGACCLPSGNCDILLQGDCINAGGTYRGDGTFCAGGPPCPAPSGACCFAATNGCLNLTQTNCAAAGGVYQGNGTNCGSIVCFPTGACCLPLGSCVGPVSPGDCTAQGGVFQGNATACGSINCPLPTGACCFSTGFCLNLTSADCATAGASWVGAFTACETANICDSSPCGICADSNCDGSVTVGDIGYFVAAVSGGDSSWNALFGGNPPCDFVCANDANGDNGVSVGDIGPFVQTLSGGPPCQ